MKKNLKAIASLMLGICIAVISMAPALAQNTPDPKVMRDCEAVNETFDNASFLLYIDSPLSKNRDLAGQEIAKKQLSPSLVLIDCDKVDQKTWKLMKKDYVSAIKSANFELKKIIIKYKLSPMIKLTCIKNGKIKKIESSNPKCPQGYKLLYKE